MEDSIEEIKVKLEKSLKTLYTQEKYLLENSANERSLTHKLAEYLQIEFPNYDVDCEYNIDIDSQNKRKKWISAKVKEKIEKILQQIKDNISPQNYDITNEVNKLSVNFYPDIIVHKRGCNKFNLLIIEAKKDFDDDFDEQKLIAFTKSNLEYQGENIYNYTLGAKIIFNTGNRYTTTDYDTPIYFLDGARE
ncbi:hypothetical protein PQ459_15125 [Chryseobacterium sp. KACC 21268]|nr:hypothetical protein PQ459_15125 [Chryseobacterium sp. KACC 21268]